ncbi:MAG: TIGR01777 family oxidoreductase [Acidimicrobiales bacterium]
MEVAVTGATGMIGSALVPALAAAGHNVRRVVRSDPGPGEVGWDPAAGTIDTAGLEGVEGVVHLAGVGIGEKRWTEPEKQRIRDSRVQGTTLLATTLARLANPPRVLVSQSAVGYYGHRRGDEVLTEESSPGTGFLAEVVRDWEAASRPATEAGIRLVNTRSGVVITPAGGALKRQLPFFRLGVGGPLGSGRQWLSWVSIHDEVGGLLHALTTDSLSGPVNLTAPNPCTSKEFARALGRALHRPAVLPVPKLALTAVVGGELADQMALASQRAVPSRLVASGYAFRHPDIDAALHAVLGRSEGAA